MSQYVITYLGGDQPASPEAGKLHMENIAFNLDEVFLDLSNLIFSSKEITSSSNISSSENSVVSL